MKNIHSPTKGKILIHNRGAGVSSPEDVEKRALEIALTEGRSRATAADRARASRELLGEALPDSPLDDDEPAEMASASRDPSDPPASRGRQTPNREGPDEQKAVERLVSEGVEEAQHEQMLAARRARKP